MKLTATASKTLESANENELREILSLFMEQVEFILNGNLGLKDNLKTFLADANFTSPLYDIPVRHDLGRPAVGYIIVGKSDNINVYDGNPSWTDNSIFLRASGVGKVKLLIF